jgi:RNA polymerase sigma-70 factor (ECF subfamily)
MQTFAPKSSFRGWLRGMVDHKVSDYLTQRRKHRRADTELLARTPDPGRTPQELWQQQWNRIHLDYCIDGLRIEYAPHTLQAFAMYVLQERPVKEISRRLGMTPNQIYVAKSRVMARIRERFGNMIDGLYGAGS